ncbi:MAG TPA: exodeoxyribonuclease VII large subunit [Chthonomonadales bacterium]|nr:exodeoxyribonuclease VII large subunit [Chthonomonadales bacterium]
MPEQRYITLSELAQAIRGAVRERFGEAVWLLAEIASVQVSRAGHVYIDLVEKDRETVLADMKAVVWSRSARILDEFEAATGKPLTAGMQVLMAARPDFHERYGLKLFIEAINAEFTLGQMALSRREVIERLRAEDLWEANKRLEMPRAPQRLAVVSSEHAAGLQDFLHQLATNDEGVTFRPELFAAAMQGDTAEASIVEAFARIARVARRYDVAVLLRGGGSQVDLSCFDTYGVAAAVARCPIPVITGIGHERDESVADMVAHTRMKTPTAAAEYLIGRVGAFADAIEDLWRRAVGGASDTLGSARQGLDSACERLASAARGHTGVASRGLEDAARRLAGSARDALRDRSGALREAAHGLRYGALRRTVVWEGRVDHLAARLRLAALRGLALTAERLEAAGRRVGDLDPAAVLRRGYTITRIGGRAVTRAGDVRPGDEIETVLHEGRLRSTVTGTEGAGDAR